MFAFAFTLRRLVFCSAGGEADRELIEGGEGRKRKWFGEGILGEESLGEQRR